MLVGYRRDGQQRCHTALRRESRSSDVCGVSVLPPERHSRFLTRKTRRPPVSSFPFFSLILYKKCPICYWCFMGLAGVISGRHAAAAPPPSPPSRDGRRLGDGG